MFGAVDKMDTQIGRGVSCGFLLGQARGLVRRRADHHRAVVAACRLALVQSGFASPSAGLGISVGPEWISSDRIR